MVQITSVNVKQNNCSILILLCQVSDQGPQADPLVDFLEDFILLGTNNLYHDMIVHSATVRSLPEGQAQRLKNPSCLQQRIFSCHVSLYQRLLYFRILNLKKMMD